MTRRKALLGALLAFLLLSGCSDNQAALRVAADHGFTQVQATGFRLTGCSDIDSSRTGFTATAPSGRRVSGVVCGSLGIFGKSYTLRLD